MTRRGASLIAIAALLLLSGCHDRGPAVRQPTGFARQTVVGGFTRATDFAVAPDGRIFIAQQNGSVLVYKNGALLDEPFLELPVNRYHERGLLAIALSPTFAQDGYVYLYYVAAGNPNDPRGPKTAQLLRVTADGDVAQGSGARVLLGGVLGDAARPSCSDFPAGSDCIPADGFSHNGGGLGFTSDGKILLSIGDAEQFWPAQDLDSLSGKVVRLNANGAAPPDNPFFTGDANTVRSKIWAYGFRNPFRLAVQPGSDLPYVGDVGSRWDEIDVAERGANYGWPCYSNMEREGDAQRCAALFRDAANTLPLFTYQRQEPGSAIISGVFHAGDGYPAAFANAFFFGDYMLGTISALRPAGGDPMPVLADAGSPVAFDIGPEGDVYYLSIAEGELRRLCYLGDTGDRCPDGGGE